MATTDKASISTLVHATVTTLGDGDQPTDGNGVSSTEKDVYEGAPCNPEANRRHSEDPPTRVSAPPHARRPNVRSNTSTSTRTVDESAIERFVYSTHLAILGGSVLIILTY